MTTSPSSRGLLLGIAAVLAVSGCVPVRTYEYRRPVLVEEAAVVCSPEYPCANAYYWDEYRSVYVFYDGYRYWDATGYAGAYPLPGPNVVIYAPPRGYVPPSSYVAPPGRFAPPAPGRYHPATPGGGYAGYTPPGRGGGGSGYVPPPGSGYGGNGSNGYSAPPPGHGGYVAPGGNGYVAPGGGNNGYVAPGGYAPPPRQTEPPQVGSAGNYVGPSNGYAPPPRESGVGVEPNGGQPHNGYVTPGGYAPPRSGASAGVGTEPGGFNAPPATVGSHGSYTGPNVGGSYAPPPANRYGGGQPGYSGVQNEGGEFGGPSRANNFTPPPPVRPLPYKVDTPPVQGQYLPNRGAFGGGQPPPQGQPPAPPAKKPPPQGPAPGPSRGNGGFRPSR